MIFTNKYEATNNSVSSVHKKKPEYYASKEESEQSHPSTANATNLDRGASWRHYPILLSDKQPPTIYSTRC